MENLRFMLTAAWDLFCMEFTIYGFTLSFRAVMLWVIVAGIVLRFIREVFS